MMRLVLVTLFFSLVCLASALPAVTGNNHTISRREDSSSRCETWPQRTIRYCRTDYDDNLLAEVIEMAIKKWTSKEIPVKFLNYGSCTFDEWRIDILQIAKSSGTVDNVTSGYNIKRGNRMTINSRDGGLHEETKEDYTLIITQFLGYVMCLEPEHWAINAHDYLAWNCDSLASTVGMDKKEKQQMIKACEGDLELAKQLYHDHELAGPFHYANPSGGRSHLRKAFDPNSIMLEDGSRYAIPGKRVIKWQKKVFNKWHRYFKNRRIDPRRITEPSEDNVKMVRGLWQNEPSIYESSCPLDCVEGIINTQIRGKNEHIRRVQRRITELNEGLEIKGQDYNRSLQLQQPQRTIELHESVIEHLLNRLSEESRQEHSLESKREDMVSLRNLLPQNWPLETWEVSNLKSLKTIIDHQWVSADYALGIYTRQDGRQNEIQETREIFTRLSVLRDEIPRILQRKTKLEGMDS